MRAFVVCVIGLVAALAAPAAQQRPSGALTPQIESVLKKIKAADKGQLAPLLANIPIAVVLNEDAPLLGAAYSALTVLRGGKLT